MKKLIVLFAVLATFFAKTNGQIVLQPDTSLVYIGSTWKYLMNVQYLTPKVAIPLAPDSVIYTFRNFPVEYQFNFDKIGDYWQGNAAYGDTCYTYTNDVQVVVTYAGRLVAFQKVDLKTYAIQDKATTDDKVWFYLKEARKGGYNNIQFQSYNPVQALINPQDSVR